MTIPLNELSAIYNQNIAEGCECDEKKKVKVKGELPGTKRPDGGDGAAPNDGKNLLATGNVPMGGSGAKRRVSKYAVEPMASEDYEGYEYAGKEGKQHKVSDGMSTKHLNNKEFGEFSRQKLGRKKKVTEGHCYVEGVECSPVEKKKDKKKVKESYSSWRDDLREVVDVADREEATKSSPKTDTEASKQIKEKNVKNKIKINPPQGVTEGFEEIGGVVVEMYEIGEDYKELPKRKMGMKAGKKIISAVGHAGKAGAEGEGTIEDQIRTQKANKKVKQADKIHDTAGKHNPNLSKLKSMKNRLTGMAKESADMTGAPSIKNAKMPKKTDVKYDSHMKVMAPSIKKEGLSVADQMKVSNEYFKKRASRSPEEKEAEKKKDAEGRAKNLAMHKKPDPYKARAGESD